MSQSKDLAAQLRQAVQGCTIHPHGPIRAWVRIEKACVKGEVDRKDVIEAALEASIEKLEDLRRLGVAEDDPRVSKEQTTIAFITKLLATPVVDKHQTPKLTVDAIVFKNDDPQQILLIERKKEPHGWALPGGFVDLGETVEEAVVRECFEETNLHLKDVQQFRTYSDPKRDPRQHNVSVVFSGKAEGQLQAKDDAKNAKFFKLDELPQLAFDHQQIIEEFIQTSPLHRKKGA